MFSFHKKVSSAIRILQEKRDASARATHLMAKKGPLMTYEKAVFGQAGSGKASGSTFFERKQMTKSFKRVALVAAAALTLGGLSAVSANATVTTFISGSTGIGCSQSLEGASTGAASCTGQVGGQVTFTYTPAATSTKYYLTVSGAQFVALPTTSASTTVYPTTGTTGDFSKGVYYTSASTSDQLSGVITASAAGAATVTVYTISTSTGATTTVDSATINWVAASTITPNAGYSTVAAHTGPTAVDTTTVSSSISADKAAVTPSTSNLAAEIKVIVRDSNNNAMNAPTVSGHNL
jgi:hypothetical protein